MYEILIRRALGNLNGYSYPEAYRVLALDVQDAIGHAIRVGGATRIPLCIGDRLECNGQTFRVNNDRTFTGAGV